jgi:hypothetical protein
VKKGVRKRAVAKGILLFLDLIGVGNSGGQEWNEEESCLVCHNRVRWRRVRSVNIRVGWVECAKLHHSPSRATNPKVQRMYRDLVLREHLSEDVCGHILSWAELDVDVPVGYGLTDEMISYIDVFGRA